MLSVENVLSVARRASAADIESGISWYNEAHDIAANISPIGTAAGAGVIAALSPRQGWNRNVMLARDAFVLGSAYGSLGHSIRKANAIIAGADPLDVLGGNKVRAFFDNILWPDHSDMVTIDRHAFDVAYGRSTDDVTRRMLDRKGVYDAVSDMYRAAASDLGITAPQLQAITWTTWRRVKGIK